VLPEYLTDFNLHLDVVQSSDMANETERSPLLGHEGDGQARQLDQNSSSMAKDPEASAEEVKMGETAVGERLKYNDYTTIDWLHDLVKCL
jgi:chloride channel 3/4/5